MSGGAHHFLAPHWTLSRERERVTVRDLLLGSTVTLEGPLANDLYADPSAARRRLAALGSLDPTLRALGDAYAGGSLTPWDRASLMRGSGYDQLFLELTARCNERCLHCYAESAPERSEALPPQTVRAVLDAGARLEFRSVQLTGGDPLVADTCVMAAAHARDVGFPEVEVYTNGVALRGQVFEALRDLRVALAFSFYSHRAGVHDAITRHPGSQARTLEAIERALNAGLDVRASIILVDANADDLDATVALLRERGVPEERIGHDRVRDVGRGRSAAEPANDVVGHAWAGPRHISSARRDFGGRIAVLPDGSVVPCIFSRDQVLGNVRVALLDDILTAPLPVAAPEVLTRAQGAALSRGLACRECQVRSSHLTRSALVPLRRRSA